MLDIENLKVYFPITAGIFGKKIGEIKAVDGITVSLEKGKTLALVGESGSGKTTATKAIMSTYKPTKGSILFNGTHITNLDSRSFKKYRKKIQVVFQDAGASLNPRRRVKEILMDQLKIHDMSDEEERMKLLEQTLEIVGLSKDFLFRYPHALSGGQKQRIAIARAIIPNPEIVILDEPTSALDVSVQAQIVSLLKKLQIELGLTYLLITHNLSLVRNIADNVAVMYLGRLMEVASTKKLFASPMHPYTIALLSTIPTIDEKDAELLPRRQKLEGEIPSPSNIPSGCRFHTRCPYVMDTCKGVEPDLIESKQHKIRCYVFSDQKKE